jgi:transcriptional regulator with XRE-family HTH domain
MKTKTAYPVGLKIRDIRKSQRITQEQLAAWLHAIHTPVTRSVVANWEIGRSDVPAFCIQIIAFSFGVKIADLLPDLHVRDLIVGQITPPLRRPRQRKQTRQSTEAVV